MNPLRIILIIIFHLCVVLNLRAQTVSYSSLYDNASFATKTIDVSKPVGCIDGNAGTSPNGGSTYNIPIKCTPGTNGMSPDISVVYNSQGGNGIMGQGWNLSGLSAITRAGWDQHHHAKTATVKYNNSDAFVLDGNYLYVKTGSNSAPESTYIIKQESYFNNYFHGYGEWWT